MRLAPLVLAAPLLLLSACDSGGEPDDVAGSTGQGGGTTTASTGATDPSGPPAGDGSTGTDSGSTSGAVSTSTTGDDPPDPTDPGSSDGGEESSTGEPPTSGPGVLPGESGIEAFCRRYVECGGTYYADQQDCLDATVGYWGDCAEVTAALDDFGACMADIACDDYNPDAYNPANTVCAEQWGDVGSAGPC